MSDFTMSKDKWNAFMSAKFDVQHSPPRDYDGPTSASDLYRMWGSHADIVMCYHAFITGEKITMISAIAPFTVELIKNEGN